MCEEREHGEKRKKTKKLYIPNNKNIPKRKQENFNEINSLQNQKIAMIGCDF